MSSIRYTRGARRSPLDASAGILAALRIIGADANRRVPVGEGFPGEGELRDSQVIQVEGNTGGIGYTARSAIPAHERLDVAPDGGERKYLESALNDNAPEVLAAIADSLRPQLDR